MKKISQVVIAFCILFSGFSFAQHTVSYKVSGLKNSRAYLLSKYGSTFKIVDSCIATQGNIVFNHSASLPAGVYRIAFADSLFTDIILNHENVRLSSHISTLSDSLKVLESKENQVYHEYWIISSHIQDTIDLISVAGNKIYEENGHKLTPALDSMARKTYQLSAQLDQITNQLIIKNPGLYVTKLLKAYVTPDWLAYKKTPGAKIYKNKNAFLKEHYFDNVDFSDSTLLYSEVFYVLCNDYLSGFVNPETDTGYINAVDFILGKAQPESPVYNYLLDLLVNTFEDTEWEETFIHLVDNYLLKNTCTPDEHDKTLGERVAVMKQLKPGNKAPEIILNDIDGRPRSLAGIEAKVTLLVFWSSTCEHCEKVMPQLQHIYAGYHPLGLEILAISADTDKKSWVDAINRQGLKWINVADLKGFQSPVIKAYNAFSTPTFFLLDHEKKIISHPYSPKAMMEGMEKAFGK
ncbi:MAG TPA: redoxin domain-containing protein [Bacteroidales bacterium]|nr:redoxin domain-containing protein [Bacteroidales bacterium]